MTHHKTKVEKTLPNHQRRLLDACHAGDLRKAKDAIKHGAWASARNLKAAAERGEIPIVELLLGKNPIDKVLEDAITYASEAGQSETFKWLMEKSGYRKTNPGKSLGLFASNGDIEAVTEILANEKDLESWPGWAIYRTVHATHRKKPLGAAQAIKIIQVLFKHGANPRVANDLALNETLLRQNTALSKLILSRYSDKDLKEAMLERENTEVPPACQKELARRRNKEALELRQGGEEISP